VQAVRRAAATIASVTVPAYWDTAIVEFGDACYGAPHLADLCGLLLRRNERRAGHMSGWNRGHPWVADVDCRTTDCPLPSGVVDVQFSTDVAQVDGATVIHVRGEIDVATCERLRDAIEPHLGAKQTIVLDLSGVQFMDSSCLHVLERTRGTLTADGGSLILRNPSEAARQLLTAAGAERLLEEDVEEHPPCS
jgi:anti-sigma B factor antagonist